MSDSIQKLLDKFKNGEERFNKSATFNKVINLLSRGVDPYTIIDGLLKTNDEISECLKETLKKSITYNVIVKSNINE